MSRMVKAGKSGPGCVRLVLGAVVRPLPRSVDDDHAPARRIERAPRPDQEIEPVMRGADRGETDDGARAGRIVDAVFHPAQLQIADDAAGFEGEIAGLPEAMRCVDVLGSERDVRHGWSCLPEVACTGRAAFAGSVVRGRRRASAKASIMPIDVSAKPASGGRDSFRPALLGTRHMIVAGHYAAAHAGFAILEAGGNAVDAGVAAGIALGVLQTDRVNFAGVAPIMIYLAERREVVTIDGLGVWPRAVTPESSSSASTAARCRPGSCAPWCRPRRTRGSRRSSITAR